MSATVKFSPKYSQTTSVELVSPKKAEEYLKLNTQNRSVSEHTVESLAAEMTAGRWRLHHQGIAIDRMNVLRDGQHRLLAIVKSGVSVPLVVTHGLDPSVFDAIDAHRPRKVGDQLALLHDLPAGRRIAAAATVIRTIENDERFGKRMPIGLALDIYKRHKAGMSFALAAIPNGPFSKAPMMGPIAYAFPTNPDQIAAFTKQLRDGERLTKKDPAYALRTQIINSDGMSNTLDRKTYAVVTLRCLHAFCEGEALTNIRANQLVDSETYQKARRYFMKAHAKNLKSVP